jgi:hypothetical protein
LRDSERHTLNRAFEPFPNFIWNQRLKTKIISAPNNTIKLTARPMRKTYAMIEVRQRLVLSERHGLKKFLK